MEENLINESIITEEFLEEYKKLCHKYNRDFVQGEIHVIKVNYDNLLRANTDNKE